MCSFNGNNNNNDDDNLNHNHNKNFMSNNNILNLYGLYEIIVYLFGHIFGTIKRI